MGEKMTLGEVISLVYALRTAVRDDSGLGSGRDSFRRACNVENLLIEAIRRLATPARQVDIEAVREVIACTRMVVGGHIQDDDRLSLKTTRWVYEQLNKLSQAIGDKT